MNCLAVSLLCLKTTGLLAALYFLQPWELTTGFSLILNVLLADRLTTAATLPTAQPPQFDGNLMLCLIWAGRAVAFARPSPQQGGDTGGTGLLADGLWCLLTCALLVGGRADRQTPPGAFLLMSAVGWISCGLTTTVVDVTEPMQTYAVRCWCYAVLVLALSALKTRLSGAIELLIAPVLVVWGPLAITLYATLCLIAAWSAYKADLCVDESASGANV